MNLRDRILHKILSAFFPYRDITKVGDDAHLYLRRYFVTKKRPGDDKRVFIHMIARSDDDRHLHDHPWDFTSYILLGGYTEETFIHGDPDNITQFRAYRRGAKLVRPAEHAHRLHLPIGQVTWTLVFRSGRERTWGFWVDSVHVPWNEYLGVNEEFDQDV